jgi:hypothetical protein
MGSWGSVRAEKELQKIKEGMPQAMRNEIIAAAEKIARQDVFGVDYKTDRHGNVLESGIGSVGNPNNATHFQALEKAEGRAAADAARERDAKLTNK